MGYEIVRGNAHGLSDVSQFLETLGALDDHGLPELRTFFDSRCEITIARAPGRLDVMGGIADYSGSLVLELPIAEATFVALQKDDAPRISIVSLVDNQTRALSFAMPLADFEHEGAPIEYDEARAYFSGDPANAWAAYVAGVFLVLARERGTRFSHGARLLISSRVPEGKGVSSSAALEVATMSAVAAAFNIEINARDLALLCQRVENLVVGAPCGVMDQMTAACGEAHQLLALLCQPAELVASIALPEELAVWGLDSGVRHSIGGGDYGSVRAGAFMGLRTLAEVAGSDADYLANIEPHEFEEKFARHLPHSMLGAEFLARFGNTNDSVTKVESDRTYAIAAPARHPIYENFRVRRFAELLQQPGGLSNDEKIALGKLMYESHDSYSACGLGSQATDRLVELVRATGPDTGLFGAKITGGGSGGTVAVLGDRNAERTVEKVAARYAELMRYEPYIF
ncbi:MAG TPA: galactokinase family protein, partial [Pyrinomonadaceae bacterium]